jgi:hypothetical protein
MATSGQDLNGTLKKLTAFSVELSREWIVNQKCVLVDCDKLVPLGHSIIENRVRVTVF